MGATRCRPGRVEGAAPVIRAVARVAGSARSTTRASSEVPGLPPVATERKENVMRNNTPAPIETLEISDSELDGVSGGIASASVNVAGYGACVGVGDVLGTAEAQLPTLPVGQFTGLVSAQTTPVA